MRICKVPFVIEDSNEPDMSPTGQLPFLMFANGKVIPEDGIKNFACERVITNYNGLFYAVVWQT